MHGRSHCSCWNQPRSLDRGVVLSRALHCARAPPPFLAAPSMHILGCCSHPFAHSISEPYNASLYILLQHIPPSPTVAMLRSGPKTTLVAVSAWPAVELSQASTSTMPTNDERFDRKRILEVVLHCCSQIQWHAHLENRTQALLSSSFYFRVLPWPPPAFCTCVTGLLLPSADTLRQLDDGLWMCLDSMFGGLIGSYKAL